MTHAVTGAVYPGRSLRRCSVASAALTATRTVHVVPATSRTHQRLCHGQMVVGSGPLGADFQGRTAAANG